MSQTQLTKIISELKKTNEKLMILALMQVPSLKPDADYNADDLKALSQLISSNVLSNNPDVSYLSRKAANHMQDKFQLTPVDENVILGDSSDDSDEFITIDESFSQDPLSLEKQLLALPDNYQDHDNILPFLMHSNNRIIATTIETLARTAYPKQELITECKPFLDSDHNRIKANAIIAIGTLDFSLVSEHLSAMFQTTKISMRESAVYAISKLQTSMALQKLLLKCLHDPYLDIRLRAIDILKRYNHPDVVTQMKRLANDLDIEICEAALETIEALQNSKSQTVEDIPQEEQPLAPFEHIQTLEEQQDTVDLDDFEPEQDNFFNSHEQESIHIENDFISIENNELDEFIIPAKPSENQQTTLEPDEKEKIQSTLADFETPIDDFDTFEITDTDQDIQVNTEQESIVIDEAPIVVETETPPMEESEPTDLSLETDLDPEFDLFAVEESTQAINNNTESIDLFAMDDIESLESERTSDSNVVTEDTPHIQENSTTEPEDHSDFDVFDDIEASESFSLETSPSVEDQPPKHAPIQDDFDLFDFNEDQEDQSKTIQDKPSTSDLTTSSEPTDDFPDFENNREVLSASDTHVQDSEVNTKPLVDEFADFPDFDEQVPVVKDDQSDLTSSPKDSNNVQENYQLTQSEPQQDEKPSAKVVEISQETLKSLQFLDEIHQKIFQQNKNIDVKDQDYFEPIKLNVADNFFENFQDKDLSSTDGDWLPYLRVKAIVPSPKPASPSPEKPRNKPPTKVVPKPEVTKVTPINKDAISAKITTVLKEIGNECYQLCQEYDPENEEINTVYKTILKIQSHLDAMIKGKIKATPKLNLKVIKRKLDQTFEKLGRITLKEINGKRFILHNSEKFQKQIRTLVKQLNS
ncbi:MAG: hypothetical protein KC646_12195 [Candidatus Cloacimonetes bacterium]|nr:hypothetical protein [Candidatus Cloacimonadota bacterium]